MSLFFTFAHKRGKKKALKEKKRNWCTKEGKESGRSSDHIFTPKPR